MARPIGGGRSWWDALLPAAVVGTTGDRRNGNEIYPDPMRCARAKIKGQTSLIFARLLFFFLTFIRGFVSQPFLSPPLGREGRGVGEGTSGTSVDVPSNGLQIVSAFSLSLSGERAEASEKGRPERPWTSLATDCK